MDWGVKQSRFLPGREDFLAGVKEERNENSGGTRPFIEVSTMEEMVGLRL